jgi:hypothetical protein
MDFEFIAGPASGAGQAAGMEQVEEPEIAGVLVEQIGDREVHRWELQGPRAIPEAHPLCESPSSGHRPGLMSQSFFTLP